MFTYYYVLCVVSWYHPPILNVPFFHILISSFLSLPLYFSIKWIPGEQLARIVPSVSYMKLCAQTLCTVFAIILEHHKSWYIYFQIKSDQIHPNVYSSFWLTCGIYIAASNMLSQYGQVSFHHCFNTQNNPPVSVLPLGAIGRHSTDIITSTTGIKSCVKLGA